MFEVTVNRTSKDILRECKHRGLIIKLDTFVMKKPGGGHWHLGFPNQPGVLELTDGADGTVSLKVANNRDGGWATAMAKELAKRR
jgi:hypothetical protein